MKSIYILTIVLLVGCSAYKTALPISTCENSVQSNETYAQAAELRSTLHELTQLGVPGVALAVYSEKNGWWEYASGLAKIEDQTAMQTCHLHYLQSIAKTYMAVVILQLYEEEKIDLDAPISSYLEDEIKRKITGSDRITVRMLLKHTSGIPEYNSDPVYVSQLLQTPEKEFTAADYIEVIAGKKLLFEPDTKYLYVNTNYELLALIADGLTGDHARYMTEHIFQPLGLTDTHYRNEKGYLTFDHLYNAYWDRNSTGILENVSTMQRQNVSNMVGDDGIVSTPRDAVLFLRGLLEGKLLLPETLKEMMAWHVDGKGEIRYGQGLDYGKFNGQVAYGHSGGGIGAGCQLYYFPEQDVYFFIGINIGTVTDSPIHQQAEPLLNKIYELLLRG